jgi:hypothetical protein
VFPDPAVFLNWWEETPMRRPREVGIGVVMLMGLSGCISMQPQGSLSSPSRTTAFGAEERPLARLAFWRRPKAESDATPVDGTVINDSSRTGMMADGTADASGVSSERPSLIRRFAQLGQRLKGKGQDDVDLTDRPAWRSGSSPSSTLSTAYATPRPVRASSGLGDPTPASNSNSTASSRGSNSTDEVTLGVSRTKPQVDEEAVPAAHTGTPAPESEPASATPVTTEAATQTPAGGGLPPEQDIVPAPVAPSVGPASSPPAPPPLSTPKPKVPTAPAVEEQVPTARTPGQTASTTTPQAQTSIPSTWSSTPVSTLGSGQRLVAASGQSIVVGETCAQPAGKKCSLLEKLCPLKKHHPLPSAQFVATSQTCDSTVVKVKKPCFLKTFLHNKTCPGKGCGCAGDGCDAHALTASPLAALPSPQN